MSGTILDAGGVSVKREPNYPAAVEVTLRGRKATIHRPTE